MKINGAIESMRPYPSPNPIVTLTEISYWSEQTLVKGMLAMPVAEGTYDGILYLRGGIQGVGMVRPARIAQFASEGFVVFAPYYRGNRGGGGRDEFGGIDRYDAVHGVTVLQQFSNGRTHAFAFSRGGIMALWTAILRDDITSVVTWGGVSDMKLTYEERVDMRRMLKRVIGGSPTKVPEAYDARTPLFEIARITCPVLIIHGLKDDNVSIEHATRLENALSMHQKRYDTIYEPQYTHYFPIDANQMTVQKACRWMQAQ